MEPTKAHFLTATEYEQWDRFVAESPQGDVFCYSWWLQAVTKDDFRILVVRENNRIVAGIILPFYGTGRINEPYLTRTTGVLYGKTDDESPRERLSKERRWLNALLDQVDINQVVQMCMHHNFKDWLPFRWRGYKQTTRYTYLLDYRQPLPDMRANISQGIKIALRNKLTVEEGDDISSVYVFSCLSFSRQNRKFPYSLDDLRRLDNAVKQYGKRAIFQAVDAERRIHAVNYVVYHEKSAYHLLIGGDPQTRSSGGQTLILWHTLGYFRDKVPVFNFGGSDLQPIEWHIRGFGGTQTQYFHIFNEALFLNREGLRYHLAQMLYHGREAFRDIGRRPLKDYPALSNKLLKSLSGKIRRGLSSKHHA